MKKARKGYALALALMVIAVGSIAVVSVVQQAQGLSALSSTIYHQYQARMLALSGIELARAQLESPVARDDSKESKNTIPQELVPFLYTNKWQAFDLEKDGFDAKLSIYIAAERGKLNLNALFDFGKKTFKKTDTMHGGALLKACDEVMKKTYGIENWSAKVLDIVQKRGRPFEDVTDVIQSTVFNKKHAALFIEPVAGKEPDERVFLADLFTVIDGDGTVQPLYLSESLQKVLRFGHHDTSSAKDRQEVVTKLGQRKTAVEWAKDWKSLLTPFYKREYTDIPDEFKKILAAPGEAAYFSVVSYATVHGITQKVCAIVHKAASPQQQYTIKRVYWL